MNTSVRPQRKGRGISLLTVKRFAIVISRCRREKQARGRSERYATCETADQRIAIVRAVESLGESGAAPRDTVGVPIWAW